MKPQNYSLKFQNSLADSRITPGSQHGTAKEIIKPKNGQRATRKLTKYEQMQANRKVSKARRLKDLNPSKIKSIKEQRADYEEQRAEEKKVEARAAENITGILKTFKVKARHVEPAIEEEWKGIEDEAKI